MQTSSSRSAALACGRRSLRSGRQSITISYTTKVSPPTKKGQTGICQNAPGRPPRPRNVRRVRAVSSGRRPGGGPEPLEPEVAQHEVVWWVASHQVLSSPSGNQRYWGGFDESSTRVGARYQAISAAA
jgi:hypothetical protein